MAQQQDDAEQLRALLDGIKTDAAAYFDKAKEALPDIQSPRWRLDVGGIRVRAVVTSTGRNYRTKSTAKQKG